MILSKLLKALKMQVKRVACILLALNLLILSGCQNIPQNSDKIKLTLWHGINPPPNRDVFKTLTDKFNQTHPHIQVEQIYIGQPDQQLPKILTSIVGNAPPDLLWNTATIAGKLAELQAIKPLEKWLDKSPIKTEIDPSLFESMELGGHTWSIPLATNNTGIFYRPSLFAAAGIKKVPQNWQELKQTARSLTQDTNGDGRTDRHGIVLPLGKGEWTVFTWLPFMFSAGGELVRETSQTPVPQIDNPGSLAALELWKDLLTEGSGILSAPERGYELDNFIAGKVAMQITGPWTLAQLQQSAIDYAVMPIPALKRSATVVGGENLFLMKTSPEREKAALEFLEYVLGEEFQTAWAFGTGYLPINLKSRESRTYQSFVKKNPVLGVFLEQMNSARSRPIISGYSRVSENLGRAIEATLLRRNPQDALKEAQDRLTLTLDIAVK
ncbi:MULTISPECIES: ABC transporter substrate-binding protein [unclassified Microcoleus]|uniref:ABC transporter substrate-binding protein n=1 Tax=unclassified Microcoleus TaxID=2642155 RepID=UPI001DA40F36|nr:MULTISPECIES: ABC transporter substrate-binding protein [unclassified Microcoleus]MCC3567904.1 ABC transporter substrate-binding protein [Microcoleus sp. PH2017_31_RDM_U_A]MCC3580143.1 ABC transporter substrate-binding protein [Microcoleus sp. PH2017_32_RDM_D_A]MCC3618250.1 ABC transporter substrate-binding protein [Microcoleus sp. PH2017_38_RDM_U_B]